MALEIIPISLEILNSIQEGFFIDVSSINVLPLTPFSMQSILTI